MSSVLPTEYLSNADIARRDNTMVCILWERISLHYGSGPPFELQDLVREQNALDTRLSSPIARCPTLKKQYRFRINYRRPSISSMMMSMLSCSRLAY